MRILHVGDIAGAPSSIRDMERKNGHKSDVVNTMPHPFNYPVDFRLRIDGKNAHSLKDLGKLLIMAMKYDRVHFHKKPVICGLDLLLLKLCGKQIYIHYHGSDIRGKKQPLIHRLTASRTFVSTQDLLADVPTAEWFPTIIIESDIPHGARKEYLATRQPGAPLRILHTPTNPKIKGTAHIQAAIARLTEEGHNIEYIQPPRCQHKENLVYMAQCDLYIDQLILGFYGTSAVEAARLGVPVICHVSPQFDSPFIRADKTTIYSTLKYIIQHPETLLETVKKEQKFYDARKATINEICTLRPENLHTKADNGFIEAAEMP